MHTSRGVPAFFNRSCCSRSLSMRGWDHCAKKKRGSQNLSIMASIVGLHAALPIKQITSSNLDDIWNKRWAIAVLLPVRRAPTHPITNGVTCLRVAGS